MGHPGARPAAATAAAAGGGGAGQPRPVGRPRRGLRRAPVLIPATDQHHPSEPSTIPAVHRAGLLERKHHNGQGSDSQAQEEGLPVLQGEGDRCRLQGHRAAPQVHLRPRQDPRPSGDRQLRPAPARRGHRGQERPRGRAAALHVHRSLRGGETHEAHPDPGGHRPRRPRRRRRGQGRLRPQLPRPARRRDPLDPRRREDRRVDQERPAPPARSATTTTPSEIKTKLEAAPVNVKVRAGEGGRLFGAVTVADIADALTEASGEQVDKRTIVVGNPIKSLGAHEVSVKLHDEVSATVALNVIPA